MKTQERSGDNPLGWEYCPGVGRNPRRVHGAWTLEDTRLPLYVIFENLAAGATIQEVSQWFEGVSEEQMSVFVAVVSKLLANHANLEGRC